MISVTRTKQIAVQGGWDMLYIVKEDVGLSETLTFGPRNLQDGRDAACRHMPGRAVLWSRTART